MDEYQNRMLLIYFTDGHGRIPDRGIENELIWILELNLV